MLGARGGNERVFDDMLLKFQGNPELCRADAVDLLSKTYVPRGMLTARRLAPPLLWLPAPRVDDQSSRASSKSHNSYDDTALQDWRSPEKWTSDTFCLYALSEPDDLKRWHIVQRCAAKVPDPRRMVVRAAPYLVRLINAVRIVGVDGLEEVATSIGFRVTASTKCGGKVASSSSAADAFLVALLAVVDCMCVTAAQSRDKREQTYETAFD